MTLLTQPRFPAGSSYAVARPRRGVTFDPAAATPYDRLPRTLNWAWWRPLVGLVVFGVLALVGSMAVVFGALLLLVFFD